MSEKGLERLKKTQKAEHFHVLNLIILSWKWLPRKDLMQMKNSRSCCMVSVTSLHYTQNMAEEELKRDPQAGHRKVALQQLSHYKDVI